MEYARQFDRINADFALRAGKLLDQYGSLTPTLPPEQRYDATLVMCVLHSLLTNCMELLTYMEGGSQKEFFDTVITDTPHGWGLRRSFIKENTFPDNEVTVGRLLEHVRDALSHPTISTSTYPTTGYTTIPDGTGLVSAFRFTNSPWVKDGRIEWYATNKKREVVERTVERFENTHQGTGYLQVRRDPDGKFGIDRDGQPFLPCFVAELPLQALISLTKHLANHLAQPTRDDWDGKSIFHLVA